MPTSAPRDPRRSLLVGACLAGFVLVVLAALVIIGIVVVFAPRRADEAAALAAGIHLARTAIS